MKKETTNEEKRKFWNSRANLGKTAGTNDFLLADLEYTTILELIKPRATVLDIGCGNGILLKKLAEEKKCTGLGIDFAEKMVFESSKLMRRYKLDSRIKLRQADVRSLPTDIGKYDYIISKRCLVNLGSKKEQKNVFIKITDHLKNGGHYIMVEDSLDGLGRINDVRKKLGLEKINPPWFNKFLKEGEIINWASKNIILKKQVAFASTYYLLSRGLYARLAADRNEKLRYDSEINLISVKLPLLGDFCPTRLWLWQKK